MSANPAERVQTGVRMDKDLVKTLKAVAALHDVTLGELLETIVFRAFAGRAPFEEKALGPIHELMVVYGLDPCIGAPASEGE